MYCLFLDERKEGGIPFFIGGISLAKEYIDTLAADIKKFKQSVHPEGIDQWEMKGSNIPYIRNIENPSDKLKAIKSFWYNFTDFLRTIKIPYIIHGCYLHLETLQKKFTKDDIKEKCWAISFYYTVVPFLLFVCIENKIDVENLKITTLSHSAKIYFDHIDRGSPERKLINKIYKDKIANDLLNKIKVELKIVEQIGFLCCSDITSDISEIIQFVDVINFALTRFIKPSKRKNGSLQILAQLEEYPFCFIRGNKKRIQEEGPDFIEPYYKLAPLYHELRLRHFKKNILGKDKKYSSLIKISENIDFNFADTLDTALWKFFNSYFEAIDEFHASL